MITIENNYEVYRDNHYVLEMKNGKPIIEINEKKYSLTCHPYEPCLYISDENGIITAIHNSFDPYNVLYSFSNGMTVTSITGMEYDAKDFCQMIEFAMHLKDIQIDYAEKIFKDREKKKKLNFKNIENNDIKEITNENVIQNETNRIIQDDPFYDLIDNYPDCVLDYCIVQNIDKETGYFAHRLALSQACQKVFVDEDNELMWQYNINKASAKKISSKEIFSVPKSWLKTNKNSKKDTFQFEQVTNGGIRPYWQAFLIPPTGISYTENDFIKINNSLFPNGTDILEIYEWTTNWSDYFDDGHEWWGTLCLTIYDKSLDRFVVIMASATD